jgi:hypothetical protein
MSGGAVFMSNGLQTWSLQKKVSVTLAAVMSTLLLLTYVILNSIVGPAFDRLEIDDAERNLVRARRAIRSDLDMLDAIVRDWASWDDAHNYASGIDPEFRKSNLERPTLNNLNLDLLLVLDADGRELWGEALHEGRAMAPSALGIFDDGEPPWRLRWKVPAVSHRWPRPPYCHPPSSCAHPPRSNPHHCRA